ncbi:hypothetical protein N2152v2_005088 [Parachlorella kessleri]
MSLPHAKRVKQLDALGKEDIAPDQDLWELHAVVHKAIQDRSIGAARQDGEEDNKEDDKKARRQQRMPNPQRVLDKLFTARGEVDVILDLVTYVEQQQFVGVAHLPRKPNSLEDLARERALRLATRKQQLKGCTSRLREGLEALRAQSEVSTRFLNQVADLRKNWRLNRHGGKDGLFYVDLSLPLKHGAKKAGGEQAGAQWNLLQDSNGDACLVDRSASGQPYVVRGVHDIHAVLQARQHVLSWQVVRALVKHEAQQAQRALDPDGLAPLLVQLATAAKKRFERDALAQQRDSQQARDSSGGGGSEPNAMDIDGQHTAARTAAAAALGVGWGPQQPEGSASGAAGSSWSCTQGSMQSAAARDALALLRSPGFQDRFESKALALLQAYLRGTSSGAGADYALTSAEAAEAGAAAGAAASAAGGGAPPLPQVQPWGSKGSSEHGSGTLVRELLAWLRHQAVCYRLDATLTSQVASHNSRASDGGAATGLLLEAALLIIALSCIITAMERESFTLETTPGINAASYACTTDVKEPEAAPTVKALIQSSKHSEARLNRLCSDRLLAGAEAHYDNKQGAAAHPTTATPTSVETAQAPLQATKQQVLCQLQRLSSELLLADSGSSSVCDSEPLAAPATSLMLTASLDVEACPACDAAGKHPALIAAAEPAPAPSTPTQQARRQAQQQQQRQQEQQRSARQSLCQTQQQPRRRRQQQQPFTSAARRCKGACSTLDSSSCQVPSALSLLFLLACYPAPASIDNQAAQAEQEQQLRDWMALQKASSQRISHAPAHRNCHSPAATPR